MTDRTKLGISTIAMALISGALGDALLRATPWGLNLLVWIAVLVGAAGAILAFNRVESVTGIQWLVIPLLFFAAAVAWRDSPVLKALNMIGIVITLAMILMRSQAGKLLAAGVTDYALGVLISVAALVLPLLLATHWLLRKEKPRDERIFRVLAGIQIALLFVMMVSALQRMRLYQREYGLTELRSGLADIAKKSDRPKSRLAPLELVSRGSRSLCGH